MVPVELYTIARKTEHAMSIGLTIFVAALIAGLVLLLVAKVTKTEKASMAGTQVVVAGIAYIAGAKLTCIMAENAIAMRILTIATAILVIMSMIEKVRSWTTTNRHRFMDRMARRHGRMIIWTRLTTWLLILTVSPFIAELITGRIIQLPMVW